MFKALFTSKPGLMLQPWDPAAADGRSGWHAAAAGAVREWQQPPDASPPRVQAPAPTLREMLLDAAIAGCHAGIRHNQPTEDKEGVFKTAGFFGSLELKFSERLVLRLPDAQGNTPLHLAAAQPDGAAAKALRVFLAERVVEEQMESLKRKEKRDRCALRKLGRAPVPCIARAANPASAVHSITAFPFSRVRSYDAVGGLWWMLGARSWTVETPTASRRSTSRGGAATPRRWLPS